MNQYFFILGKNPGLSILEITSQINGKIINLSDSFLILQLPEKIDHNFWQEKLGGTIKIGLILGEQDGFKPSLAAKLLENFRRPHFGFSFYGSNNSLANQDKEWAMEIKNQLKQKNVSSRWVVAKEKSLSSVVIMKNKLITEGIEFCFLTTASKSYFGQTLSCQKFEDYSHRDFDRPARDIEEGMLPPKLAKIMINLAMVSNKQVVLDPFCGSGTILQEAILMGHQHLIGTDLSENAIANSQKNIKWLIENYSATTNFHLNSNNYQLFQADVRNISSKISSTSIDAIITEPYLGPIKNKYLDIKKVINELSDLYLKAFNQFKKILKPTGKIVIIFPVFNLGNGLKFLPILEELKKMNWQIINPTPTKLKESSIIKTTVRGSILYARQDQQVLREIFIFEHAKNH